MLNKSTFITLFALFLLGSFTYAIKQKVIELDNELAQSYRSITQYQESIHILHAEWAYLVRPSRLQILVQEHTCLHQSPGTSLVSYEEVFCGEEHQYQENTSMHLASMKGH